VAKDSEGKVTGYRVGYKEWSSRFDEWVEPKRVVEPNDNNLLVQVSEINLDVEYFALAILAQFNVFILF